MAFDFSKIRPPKERKVWRYKCAKCGEELEYLTAFPDRVHSQLELFYPPCDGELELVKVATIPLSNGQEQERQ